MICENMKTLQSTLVQKGEGEDVDWPFWVQQVNNFTFYLIIRQIFENIKISEILVPTQKSKKTYN